MGEVALYMSAWIEIAMRSGGSPIPAIVALYMSAWIEIFSVWNIFTQEESHST